MRRFVILFTALLVALFAFMTPITPWAALATLMTGVVAAWLTCAVGARRAGVRCSPADLLASPAYWALQSVAFAHAAVLERNAPPGDWDLWLFSRRNAILLPWYQLLLFIPMMVGATALRYARDRYNQPDGDFGRSRDTGRHAADCPVLGRDRPAQVGTAQGHAGDAAPLQVRGQAPAGGFDFGQLGHPRIVAQRDGRQA
mgnify:CR=1 FL=1